ncbi:orotidine-5'-phosphate decarboxylase [Dongshaea marina]|uniref:orotidine-5'-phosphate decarboxylase n=1 Tax=Dongshaea marina TaxID=2047966 RepID=UPI000D3E0C83|nr:orotidine-5'-phosphate decarboxylase [Dongshaea marina]
MQDPRVIVALDFSSPEPALSLAEQLDPKACRLKIGKELFTLCGPELVRQLVGKGFELFLDLKFHDIPNTVAKAVAASAELGVWMVNVHASGGMKMMEAAREALEPYGKDAPLLIGVTVLTSMEGRDLRQIGLDETPIQQVMRLARLTQEAGLDGVVCSAQEAPSLRDNFSQEFKLVTPGIRPDWSSADDQRRIMTPPQAIRAGSDYLVIGRPITQSADPAAALAMINESLAGA